MKIFDRWIRRLEWEARGVKVWKPCNIYRTAQLGKGVSVGMFSEVGDGVVIGDWTRIGMGVFIPKGTTIGSNCFIAPKVCFVHDLMEWDVYPGDTEEHWKATVVEDYVTIGANAMIRPGVRIGSGALIGLGAVVTKDIGAGEVWYGNPAEYKRERFVYNIKGGEVYGTYNR